MFSNTPLSATNESNISDNTALEAMDNALHNCSQLK